MVGEIHRTQKIINHFHIAPICRIVLCISEPGAEVKHYLESERFDAFVHLGNGDDHGFGLGGQRDFLSVKLKNGKKRIFELEDFCMISFNGSRNIGLFTVFNRELDLLHIKYIKGSPDLTHAKFSLTTDNDEDVNTSNVSGLTN